MPLSTAELGARITRHRGTKGIRAAAAEIGVSPATLSRVEKGHVPDLDTFEKICMWLDVDPGEFLGSRRAERPTESVSVHFRKGKTVSEKTARSLANMILTAQQALRARESIGG
jgi:transcriptional regulator with XRE-family HTH domain